MPSATTGEKHRVEKRWHRMGWALLAIALLLGDPVLATEERASEPEVETLADLPKLDPSVRTNTHKVVLITADSLSPAAVDLHPGQLIAWISYSPTQSTVVFERDVAKSMVCHSRVNFSFEAGELRSAPINAGEFASFCELKPGSYRYKVERSTALDPAGADSGGMLEGEIVVGEK